MSAKDAYERVSVERQLPAGPIRAPGGTPVKLERFEVVIAYNLDMPWRYAQEMFWLEVLAETELQAARTARGWVLRAGDSFELTNLVRRGSEHERHLGHDHRGQPLAVRWNVPLLRSTPPGVVVREPVTGLRIGFVAGPEAEKRWLRPDGADRYRLITRKPTAASDPVCLVPLVELVEPAPDVAEGEEGCAR